MNALERILHFYDDYDFVIVKGLDAAVVGVEPESMSLVYSIEMCIKILVKGGMSQAEAIEYFNDNILFVYDGPIFIYTLKD